MALSVSTLHIQEMLSQCLRPPEGKSLMQDVVHSRFEPKVPNAWKGTFDSTPAPTHIIISGI